MKTKIKTVATLLILLIISAVTICPASAKYEIRNYTKYDYSDRLPDHSKIVKAGVAGDLHAIKYWNDHPQPILPLEPDSNNVPSIETNYKDLGSLQLEIILDAEGFKPPASFNQDPNITSIKQSIEPLTKNGFIIINTTYEKLDTTHNYNTIKNDIITESTLLPNCRSIDTSIHTYQLYNPNTTEDAIIIQCYLSDQNKNIIGKPVIAKTTTENTNTTFKKTPSTQTSTSINKNHENRIASSYSSTNLPNAIHKNSILTPDESPDVTPEPESTKYVFTPLTYYGKNTIKGVATVVVAIALFFSGKAIIVAYIAEKITGAAVMAATVSLTSATTMLITLGVQFASELHEYYPIHAQAKLIEKIHICPTDSKKLKGDIPVDEDSKITLDERGGMNINTGLTTCQRIWSPFTTLCIRHFPNVDKKYPHTVYKTPLNITIPNDADSIMEYSNVVTIIQNGARIAAIEQPPRSRVDITIYRENGEFEGEFKYN